jgi:hypothetical protein
MFFFLKKKYTKFIFFKCFLIFLYNTIKKYYFIIFLIKKYFFKNILVLPDLHLFENVVAVAFQNTFHLEIY